MPERLTPEAREQIRQRIAIAIEGPWPVIEMMAKNKPFAMACSTLLHEDIPALLAELDAEKHERAIAEAARDANGAQAQKFLEIVERLGVKLDVLRRERDEAIADEETAIRGAVEMRARAEQLQAQLTQAERERDGLRELLAECSSFISGTSDYTTSHLLAEIRAALQPAASEPATDPRKAVSKELRARAEQYQTADGDAGPLGCNCWGWRDIAKVLRDEADRISQPAASEPNQAGET